MVPLAILAAPVAPVDSSAPARRYRRPRPMDRAAGPFAYRDTASARAGLDSLNARLRGYSVGIVGPGGTGSHVLGLVAKCCVASIRLFDDDVFEQHSAFRAPGAATVDDLRAARSKVDHSADVYRRIHRGEVPHARRIDRGTAPLLDVLDFAFICIDDASAKPAIIDRLVARRIPSVDVGMGLRASERGIAGAIRTALVTLEDGSMLDRVPTLSDPEGVYATDIQICELSALNAALAVIAWKRHVGFYAADRRCSNEIFVVESGPIPRASDDARRRADRGTGGEHGLIGRPERDLEPWR